MSRSPRLGRAASYWTAAAVAVIALWTSGAPSTSYPLYAELWHLSPIVTTAIFGTYPLTLVLTLLATGSLSDHIGRRGAILLGVAGMLVGTSLFAIAGNVVLLFLGRAVLGIGVGLALSPASAAVLEYSKPSSRRIAASVTTAATALGVTMSTLVGGALVQYGPLPLALDYWVLAAVIVGVGVFAWFLPRNPAASHDHGWRPAISLSVPPRQRLIFVTAALSSSIAYMTGGIFLALGASIARQLVHTDNTLVIGALLALMFVTVGVTAVLARRVGPRLSMRIGGAMTGVAFVLLASSALLQSLPVFVLTALTAGIAYASAFSGGLGYVSVHAPASHRASVISALYLAAYGAQGLIAVALGLTATFIGLFAAVLIGSAVMTVLGITTVVLTLIRRHREGAPTTRSLLVSPGGNQPTM